MSDEFAVHEFHSFLPFARLSNGYIIKIGRGLNYFLPADKFCLGQSNYDFRKCKETNVDIFYCPENKTS